MRRLGFIVLLLITALLAHLAEFESLSPTPETAEVVQFEQGSPPDAPRLLLVPMPAPTLAVVLITRLSLWPGTGDPVTQTLLAPTHPASLRPAGLRAPPSLS